MTEDKQDDISKINIKNDTLEMLPLDSNLIFANSSFNFFESTVKKEHSEEDKDILIVNSKKNLNKNF